VTAVITAAQLLAVEETSSGSSTIGLLLPMVVLGVLFYIFILMPQRRRQKRTRQMQAEMGVGDEVRTIGGIIGTIVSQDEQTFTLDLGGSTMRVVKRAVAEMVNSASEEDSDS
jgi:preprotein translocase subunit YajC